LWWIHSLVARPSDRSPPCPQSLGNINTDAKNGATTVISFDYRNHNLGQKDIILQHSFSSEVGFVDFYFFLQPERETFISPLSLSAPALAALHLSWLPENSVHDRERLVI